MCKKGNTVLPVDSAHTVNLLNSKHGYGSSISMPRKKRYKPFFLYKKRPSSATSPYQDCTGQSTRWPEAEIGFRYSHRLHVSPDDAWLRHFLIVEFVSETAPVMDHVKFRTILLFFLRCRDIVRATPCYTFGQYSDSAANVTRHHATLPKIHSKLAAVCRVELSREDLYCLLIMTIGFLTFADGSYAVVFFL